jgi:hypothetical protein
MTIRDFKRSFPNKRSLYLDYIREIKQNWLKESHRTSRIIIASESKMVYRMTLGSIYYDLEIKKSEAKETETEIGRQAAVFLKTKHPDLWRKWLIVKKETNSHLDYIAGLWKEYILDPVKNILSTYPMLAEHKNAHDENEFYVEQYIKEGVYLEIQHYAAVGYRLDLFRMQKESNTVGNGYTFMASSNTQLLQRFIDSINMIINNEKVLNHFRTAEI